jgi:hypothetical protein
MARGQVTLTSSENAFLSVVSGGLFAAVTTCDALSFLSTAQLIAVLPAYLDLLIALGPRSPVPETLLPLLTRPPSFWNTISVSATLTVTPLQDPT